MLMNFLRQCLVPICVIAALSLLPKYAVTVPPPAAVEAELAVASDEFRRLFAAARFAEALPFAARIVELNEALGRHPDLAGSFNDLGSVQLNMGLAADAEASFSRALELLVTTEKIASPRFIATLSGLAAAFKAQGQFAQAADALRQAIAISRRGSGLFNAEQLPLLESLVDVYEALGDDDGSEQELRYSVQVLEQAYGRDDLRVTPALRRLAEWYDKKDRPLQARLYWVRVLEIAAQEDGGRNATTIAALTAIARSHRLQYVRDPKSIGLSTCPVDPKTGQPKAYWYCTDFGRTISPAKAGEAAALKALELLDETTDPPPALLVRTLIELGDWYATVRKPKLATEYYMRAWPLVPEALATGEPHPFRIPVPLSYRPPAASRHYRHHSESSVTPIEFTLTVTAEGATTDIRAVTEAESTRITQVRRALAQARFRPRFEDGLPVETKNYRHVESWYEPPPGLKR
jgi:tetratricopeptide (TPR) repeat protein